MVPSNPKFGSLGSLVKTSHIVLSLLVDIGSAYYLLNSVNLPSDLFKYAHEHKLCSVDVAVVFKVLEPKVIIGQFISDLNHESCTSVDLSGCSNLDCPEFLFLDS